MTSARNAAGVGELWERMRLGVSHRVHEMGERERAEFFEGGGEAEAEAEEAEGSEEEEERRLRRVLRRYGVRYDRRELREARRAEEGGGERVAPSTRERRRQQQVPEAPGG